MFFSFQKNKLWLKEWSLEKIDFSLMWSEIILTNNTTKKLNLNWSSYHRSLYFCRKKLEILSFWRTYNYCLKKNCHNFATGSKINHSFDYIYCNYFYRFQWKNRRRKIVSRVQKIHYWNRRDFWEQYSQTNNKMLSRLKTKQNELFEKTQFFCALYKILSFNNSMSESL